MDLIILDCLVNVLTSEISKKTLKTLVVAEHISISYQQNQLDTLKKSNRHTSRMTTH